MTIPNSATPWANHIQTTTCGYRDMNLENSLTLFSKIIVVGLPPGLRPLIRFTVPGTTSLLWSRFRIQAESSWWPPCNSPLMAPEGTSCLAGWYCRVQGSVLGKITDVFSPPYHIACHNLAPWKLAGRQRVSYWFQDRASYVMHPECCDCRCTSLHLALSIYLFLICLVSLSWWGMF